MFLKNATIEELSMEVSNRMSLNVNYWLQLEVLQSEKWESFMGGSFGPFLIPAHSENRRLIIPSSGGMRVRVSYERQLKPFEASILNKLPWLKQHYPFQRRYSSPIYEWRRTEK